MTEEEKMLAGKLYDPSDPKLETRRLLAHRLSMEYNNTPETDAEKRKAILAQLLPDCGEDTLADFCNLTPAAIPASANAATPTSIWSFWTCVR